jgi:hypothetical protein
VEEAIIFLRAHHVTKESLLKDVASLTLSWIPDKW